jgi:DNA repair exonuclease SbcCD nuclease subunit
MTKFIHCSDVHLGKTQYGLEQRAQDFANVFNNMATFAIREKVDFVLIAGDLFEKANIHPMYYNQGINVLKRLRESNIPVYAIRGNHDGKLATHSWSWLRILNNEGYLHQFIPQFSKNKDADRHTVLPAWNNESRSGAVLEKHGLRISGMGYYGSFTKHYLDQLVDEIPNDDVPNLFMLHAGLEGYYPPMGGGLLLLEDLKELGQKVDYLALGHIHQSFSHEGWIHNPGSLENWEVRESYKPHGFYMVEAKGNEFSTSLIEPKRRNVYNWNFPVDGFSSFDSLFENFKRFIEEETSHGSFKRKSVIHLRLNGELKFSSLRLDVRKLKEFMITKCDALIVMFHNETIVEGMKFVSSGDRVTRSQLERQIFEHLIKQDTEWEKYATDLADELIDLKPMLMTKADPEEILNRLRNWRAMIENK